MLCPRWLEPEAKREWRRLARKLQAAGVLTDANMTVFAGYCQAYARWREAEDRITDRGFVIRTPSGYDQQLPYVPIAQRYLEMMLQFAEQLGLTANLDEHTLTHSLGDVTAI